MKHTINYNNYNIIVEIKPNFDDLVFNYRIYVDGRLGSVNTTYIDTAPYWNLAPKINETIVAIKKNIDSHIQHILRFRKLNDSMHFTQGLLVTITF